MVRFRKKCRWVPLNYNGKRLHIMPALKDAFFSLVSDAESHCPSVGFWWLGRETRLKNRNSIMCLLVKTLLHSEPTFTKKQPHRLTVKQLIKTHTDHNCKAAPTSGCSYYHRSRMGKWCCINSDKACKMLYKYQRSPYGVDGSNKPED